MEHTTPNVLKSNGIRPVQATDQHDGEKFQKVLVLPQHEASLECLFPVSSVLHDFYRYMIFTSTTMQNGERAVRVADVDIAPSRNSGVELVVLRGQVSFESEESLCKFLSNMVSMSLHAHTNSRINCACMHCLILIQEGNRSSHHTSECQNGRVQLIHSHVEAVFASAAELGSYVNKFSRPTS